MRVILLASLGLALGGWPGAMAGLAVHGLTRLLGRARRPTTPIRPILLLLLVELRGGRSALGALQAAAGAYPGHRDLVLAARVATISGLTSAVGAIGGPVAQVISQLARAQRSGASLAETVRAMIEADIAAEKTRRLSRARTLPVRLMVPLTLLVLPGLVLLFYAPSILHLFDELARPLP